MPSKTLDYYHKQKINKFEKNKKIIAQIELKIKQIKEKIATKNQAKNEKFKLRIDKLKTQKQKYIDDENNYYLNVMDLLSNYYNTRQSNFNKQSTNKANKNDLTKFIDKKTTVNKEKIFNEYMFRLNNDTKHKKISYVDFHRMCKYCNVEQTLDSLKSTYVCEQCGNCSFVLLEPEKTTYVKNPLIESCSFSYRRYDHFCEWLAKFHNIDKSKVPKNIYILIKKELKKSNFDKKLAVNKENILEILKKTGHSKYNCQVFQIMNVINKKKLPKLPQIVQHKMKIMFKQTQQPFAKICPDNRTNFLSYSYVIRKFLEILKQYEYIEYFPLLKSKEKLYNQDLIFKDICNQLNWEFNPSI